LALLLPIGALAAVPVAALSPVMIAGFLSFGLMALLYLVTEELLVEAHEKPDTPLISSKVGSPKSSRQLWSAS
jgi:ZIP family zinc transporter